VVCSYRIICTPQSINHACCKHGKVWSGGGQVVVRLMLSVNGLTLWLRDHNFLCIQSLATPAVQESAHWLVRSRRFIVYNLAAARLDEFSCDHSHAWWNFAAVLDCMKLLATHDPLMLMAAWPTWPTIMFWCCQMILQDQIFYWSFGWLFAWMPKSPTRAWLLMPWTKYVQTHDPLADVLQPLYENQLRHFWFY